MTGNGKHTTKIKMVMTGQKMQMALFYQQKKHDYRKHHYQKKNTITDINHYYQHHHYYQHEFPILTLITINHY